MEVYAFLKASWNFHISQALLSALVTLKGVTVVTQY